MSKQEILKTLEPLFKKAETNGLWFYCCYQDLWLSPTELKDNQANGSYVWGVDNWELRNPQENIDCLKNKITYLHREIKEFKKRI